MIIVNTIPSSSECHFYRIKSSRIELIKTYSIGSSKPQRKHNEKSSNRYSVEILSTVVKLALTKREEEYSTKLLLFALKSDGDIYLMEIDNEQLMNK